MNYISGSYVNDENHMFCTDNVRRVTMRFDSQWCRSIEIVFEGVLALNLRPCQDNYSADLHDASLFIQDEVLYFFDSRLDNINKSYDGTWIESYSIRWRFYN